MVLMQFVQENILWVSVAVTSGTMLLWQMSSGAGRSALSPAEATLLINRADALVLDVRDSADWSAGHIVGARHIAHAQLANHLSELEKFKSRPIIVCCAAGNRAGAAGAVLKKAGFATVHTLAGGVAAWRGANLPLTTKG